MPQNDEQLVQQVVQRVLAALERRESGGGAPRPSGGGSTPIRPPVGVCTGDYSQFKDRPDLAGSQTRTGDASRAVSGGGGERSEAPGRPPAPADLPASGVAADEPPALTGIVTAEQLRAAAKAAPDGKARLDAKARLTPLANDLVRESPELMVRAGATASVSRSGGSSADTNPAVASHPWLWWADGHCPGVQALTNDRRDALRPSAAGRDQAGLSQVLRDIALGVHGNTLAGGVLFVRSACRPLLLANRCPNLRAVSTHRADALDRAIAELSPNVLILEYPRVSGEMLASLVEKVLSHTPHPPAVLSRELRELSHLM